MFAAKPPSPLRCKLVVSIAAGILDLTPPDSTQAGAGPQRREDFVVHERSVIKISPFFVVWLLAVASSAALADKCGSKLGPFANALSSKSKDAAAVEIASFHESGDVYGLAFSPDYNSIATAVWSRREIRLWNWKSGHLDHELKEPAGENGGGNEGQSESVAIGPRNDVVVSCHIGYNRSPAGSVVSTIWDVHSGAYLKGLTVDSTCEGVSFTPDGSRLLQTVYSGISPVRAILYDTTSWLPVWHWDLKRVSPKSVTAISPDGRFAAIGSSDVEPRKNRGPMESPYHGVSRVHILDINSGMEVKVLETSLGENDIGRVAWSADGQTIAVGGSSTYDAGPLTGISVTTYDVDTGKVLVTEPSDTRGRMGILRYTPDGRYLFESGIRDTVEIWDGQHKALLQEICAQPSSSAISSDGKYLALGGGAPHWSGGKVRVYELN
jgi:WD40 repeat protein